MRITELGATRALPRPDLAYVAAIRADIGPSQEFTTSHGMTRAMFPIIGGAIAGDGIDGTIIPGGADFARRLPDGSYAIEARYMIMLTDGTPLAVWNAGRMMLRPDGSFEGRTRAEIDAPEGPHGWLTDAVLFGTALSEAEDDHVWIELWHAHL